MDRFETLLWDLGEITQLPLHQDKHRACTLLLEGKLKVQLQMEQSGKHLIACAFLGEIPPGRFREEVLKEALKVNHRFHPFGFFAFYEQKSQLVLHQLLLEEGLSAECCLQEIELLIEEADEWRLALEAGQTCPIKYRSVEGPPPPFMQR